MESNCSHAPKLAVNLKHLPPIDPFRITNGKLNNSCSGARAAAKDVKPNPNQETKLLHSNKDVVENPSFGNIVVEDASSNPKSESCGTTTSPTQSHTERGMKKGTARSNLYEICAANHWKPPIFECCKEEGPSHKRMFTFKVIIEIEASRNIIECYGAPHRKKKAAADHAAEGALLYLKVYRMCYEKPINK
ncbi:Ribonuclease 3 protein 1 [Spatholobus suberectus]|nr:Ribonuclease 3 protein 1 [Spatholobus suberectus]